MWVRGNGMNLTYLLKENPNMIIFGYLKNDEFSHNLSSCISRLYMGGISGNNYVLRLLRRLNFWVLWHQQCERGQGIYSREKSESDCLSLAQGRCLSPFDISGGLYRPGLNQSFGVYDICTRVSFIGGFVKNIMTWHLTCCCRWILCLA